MTDKRIKVGFIGAGNHATWTLYPCFQYFPQIDLIGVCDLDRDKAQSIGSRFGAKHFYDDYHKMLDSEPLEALFCCGGPALHAAVIAEAIKRKIPLFVEKPPAATSGELKQLMQQAENSDVPIMVGFMHRFASISVWARKAMASAQFGETMTIYAREGCWAMPIGGLVRDSGIHHIDLMRFLADEEVQWVQSTQCTDGDKRHAIVTVMQFKNGVVGQLSLNTLESFSEPSDLIEIHGNNGQWLRLDNWDRAVWFRSPGKQWPPWSAPDNPAESSLFYEHTWTTAGTNKSVVIQGYVGEIGHFVECLENGSKPTPNLCDGYRALQLVEAINESARSGERVLIE